MLKTEDIIFQRDEDGELISKEIIVEMLQDKPTIKAKPLTRGKLMEIHQMAQSSDSEEKAKSDTEILKHGLVKPELTEEQLKDLKPSYAGPIAIAIMSLSLGMPQKDIKDKSKEVLKNIEDDLKKKDIMTK